MLVLSGCWIRTQDNLTRNQGVTGQRNPATHDVPAELAPRTAAHVSRWTASDSVSA
jgi:hypothetical protein